MVRAAELKLFTAAVRALVASTVSIPESLARTRASFVLLRVFSRPRPCLENSVAASAAALKLCPVLAAILKSCEPNFCKFPELAPNTTLMSFNCFSTSIVDLSKNSNPCVSLYKIPAEAANATTRALEASKDFWNSLKSPVILPRGWRKDLSSSFSLTPFSARLNALETSFSIALPSKRTSASNLIAAITFTCYRNYTI